MANMRLASAARNAVADALTRLIDRGSASGTIKIYTAPQPGNADNRVSSQILLGILTFSSEAAPAASGGIVTFNPIDEENAAKDKGKAAWARIADADGNTVFDCDVTDRAGGGTIQLNTTDIAKGGPIRITSFTVIVPAG